MTARVNDGGRAGGMAKSVEGADDGEDTIGEDEHKRAAKKIVGGVRGRVMVVGDEGSGGRVVGVGDEAAR